MTTLSGHLVVWLALWLAGGGLLVVLVRRGFDYVTHPVRIAAFFVVLTAVMVQPFWPLVRPRLAAIAPESTLAIAGVAASAIVAHAVLRARVSRPTTFIDAHPHIYWLRLDDRYLVSKPFEILFQQALLVSLVSILDTRGVSTPAIVLVCMALFGASHVFLFRLVGRLFGWFYLASSMVAAVAFPIAILRLPNGIVWSFAGHWLYYIVSAVAFWLVLSRASTRT